MKIAIITPEYLTAAKDKASARNLGNERLAAATAALQCIEAALDPPIIAALQAVNGRATSFTTTTAGEVRRAHIDDPRCADGAGLASF